MSYSPIEGTTSSASTGAVSITWTFEQASDVYVWAWKTSDGTLKKSGDGHVSFTLSGVPGNYEIEITNPWGAGVEMRCRIFRDTAREQNFTATSGVDLDPASLVGQFDRVNEILEERYEDPFAVTSADAFEVPPKEARASKVLAFDSDGDPDLSSAAGTGDMTKAVYDTDADGRVDVAEGINDGTHSATASDISDAVSKKHTQGTDQGLDTGGASAVTAATIVAHHSNTSNPHSVTASQAGAAATSHTHDSADINSGTLDGDRLPAMSTTKKGGVPATGTPSGLYLKDDGTWAAPSGGGDMTKAVYDTDDNGIVDKAESVDDGTSATTAAQVKTAYDHSQVASGNPHSVTKSDVSLGNVENLKVNLSATAAPTVTDDSSAGYSVGSRWMDVTADKSYVCLDASVGAAVWHQTDASGGGVTDHGALTGLEDDDHSQYALLAGRSGDRLILADDAATPPLQMTERSAAPSTPSSGDLYLDDGTNTASGSPGWRRYTGSAWEDVGALSGGSGGSGGTVQGTDGNTYNIRATDEGTTAGNARGENSVDLQTVRASASQVASGAMSTISGGKSNTASDQYATVGGGLLNDSAASLAAIGGGMSNSVTAGYSVIPGGYNNTVSGQYSFAAGSGNDVSGVGASALGGSHNVTQNYGFAGGQSHMITATYATAFGYGNTVSGSGAFAGGRNHNLAGSDSASFGYQNSSGSSGSCSFLTGKNASGERYGEKAQGTDRISTNGDIQNSRFVIGDQTTSGAAQQLYLDGATGTKQLVLRSGEGLHIKWHAVAKNTGATEYAGWNSREFTVKYDGTNIAFVGTAPVAVSADQADSSLGSATIQPKVDTTNFAVYWEIATSIPAATNVTIVVDAAVTI